MIITRFGITWDVTAPASGQFINGDYWVQGPAVVNSVSPAPDSGKNGSIVNPPGGKVQSYDSRIPTHTYNADAVAQFPLTLNAGDSLVSTISHEKPKVDDPDNVPWVRWSSQNLYLKTSAVLTCVAEAPTADTFRPPFIGTEKPLFKFSDIDKSVLPNLAWPENETPPDLETYERFLERPWFDHGNHYATVYLTPTNNSPDYAMYKCRITNRVALMLCCDNSDGKYDTLFTRYVQLGIDLWGIANNTGWTWGRNADGIGRRLPILFAGLLFNNDAMLNQTSIDYGEKYIIYDGPGYRNQTPCWCESTDVQHEQYDPSEWATKPRPDPNDGWKSENYRAYVYSQVHVSTALCARLIGGLELFGNALLLPYADRYVAERNDLTVVFPNTNWKGGYVKRSGTEMDDGSTADGLTGDSYNAFSTSWERAMWELYREYDGPPDTPPDTGDDIAQIKARLDVIEESLESLESDVDALKPLGERVSLLENEVDVLQVKIEDIDALAQRIDVVDGRLDKMEPKVEDIDPIKQDVATMQDEIGSINAKLEALDTLSGRVGSLETSMGELEKLCAAIDDRVSEIEKLVVDLKNVMSAH